MSYVTGGQASQGLSSKRLGFGAPDPASAGGGQAVVASPGRGWPRRRRLGGEGGWLREPPRARTAVGCSACCGRRGAPPPRVQPPPGVGGGCQERSIVSQTLADLPGPREHGGSMHHVAAPGDAVWPVDGRNAGPGVASATACATPRLVRITCTPAWAPSMDASVTRPVPGECEAHPRTRTPAPPAGRCQPLHRQASSRHLCAPTLPSGAVWSEPAVSKARQMAPEPTSLWAIPARPVSASRADRPSIHPQTDRHLRCADRSPTCCRYCRLLHATSDLSPLPSDVCPAAEFARCSGLANAKTWQRAIQGPLSEREREAEMLAPRTCQPAARHADVHIQLTVRASSIEGSRS